MQTGNLDLTDLDSDELAKDRLHAEIARANLLRMRGDYKGAVDQCLSVLKRMPEEGDTHTLLGDIYAEQGNLEEAVQWYEMALDLNPRSKTDAVKLEQVRQRSRDREAASAVEQLDLPTDRPNIWLIGGSMTVIALALAVGAFILGQHNVPLKSARSARSVPITAPLQADGSTEETPTAPAPDTVDKVPPVPTVNTDRRYAQEDVTLTQLVSQRSSDGIHLLAATEDPRSKVVSLTFTVGQDDDTRKIGAELARTTLAQASDAQLIVVRAVRDGHLAFVADVPRARWQESESDAWKQANPAVDAWIGHLLTNEWTHESGSTTPPAESTSGEATGP